ncbi:MAG: hypothetical protein IPG60_06685 [Bacteroidetes bacterium]|nr:hypothetical protein [Bacteroidota bacterium]
MIPITKIIMMKINKIIILIILFVFVSKVLFAQKTSSPYPIRDVKYYTTSGVNFMYITIDDKRINCQDIFLMADGNAIDRIAECTFACHYFDYQKDSLIRIYVYSNSSIIDTLNFCITEYCSMGARVTGFHQGKIPNSMDSLWYYNSCKPYENTVKSFTIELFEDGKMIYQRHSDGNYFTDEEDQLVIRKMKRDGLFIIKDMIIDYYDPLIANDTINIKDMYIPSH